MELWNTGLGVGLSGMTHAQLPELGGTVLRDAVRQVVFTDRESGRQAASASVQDRVIRSTSTGLLDFNFRVVAFEASEPGLVLTHVARGPFPSPPVDVDYRLDGVGEIGPASASWPASSSDVQFAFLPPGQITPGKQSRFVYVRSDASEFVDTGVMALGLSSPTVALALVGAVHAYAPRSPERMRTTEPPDDLRAQ
jgi:hypothetical protein